MTPHALKAWALDLRRIRLEATAHPIPRGAYALLIKPLELLLEFSAWLWWRQWRGRRRKENGAGLSQRQEGRKNRARAAAWHPPRRSQQRPHAQRKRRPTLRG